LFSGSQWSSGSVTRAFQVHTREGMPGLELVDPRGRPLLRPGWGRIGFAYFPENVARLRPHHERLPATSGALGRLAARGVNAVGIRDPVVVRLAGKNG